MMKLLMSAVALSATSLAAAQSATYTVEPGHTFVYFEVVHSATSTTRGRFDDVQGSITLNPTDKTGHANIVIDSASVSSGVPPFDEHLRNADFLNVPLFPKATFVGDGFSFEGDKVSALSGVLTLLGKTQAVTLRASRFNCYDNPRSKRHICGGDFETTLQRSKFGMRFGLPGIPDDVRVLIQIEAIRQ
jgi:polyisoprenoid-binding protein YceI